jgi:RimJ/RimL family protein N-acetyltransferase
MLFLRPLDLSDIVIYSRWGQDQRFCEQAGWTVDLPLSGHEAHWRRLVTGPPPDLVRLAAVLDDEVVGYVDLHGDDPRQRELGYVVGPSARWGQGLGTAIARLGLDHGFGHLGLEEITAEALDTNQASIRILITLGMTKTGTSPSSYQQFLITKAEWERGQPSAGSSG